MPPMKKSLPEKDPRAISGRKEGSWNARFYLLEGQDGQRNGVYLSKLGGRDNHSPRIVGTNQRILEISINSNL